MVARLSPLRTGKSAPLQVGHDDLLTQEETAVLDTQGRDEVTKGFVAALDSMRAGTRAERALFQELEGDPRAAATRESALRAHNLAGIKGPRVRSLSEVDGVGDFVDLAAGAVGSGLATTLPSLAGGLLMRGRGRLRTPGAVTGAAVPAYDQEFGESALNYQLDPVAASRPVEERIATARGKAAINTIPEAFVPGRVAASVPRGVRGVAKNVGTNALTEAGTETFQQAVGSAAHQRLNPEVELTPLELADAATQGFFGGAGITAAGTAINVIPNTLARGVELAGDVADATKERRAARADNGGADPDAPAAAGPSGPVDLGGGDGGAANNTGFARLRDAAGNLINNISERVNTASEGSPTPAEFAQRVFGDTEVTRAASVVDLEDVDNPNLRGATREETAANLRENDRSRIGATAQLAKDLLQDPDTHQAVKERIMAMGGDFSDRINQRFILGVSQAKQAAKHTQGFAEDFLNGAQDVFRKKSLIGVSDDDVAATERLLFQHLTPAARENPVVRTNLSKIAEEALRMSRFAPEDTAPEWAYSLVGLLDDAQAFSDALATGREGEVSFIDAVRSGASAQADVDTSAGVSFLEASIDKRVLAGADKAQVRRVARAVDGMKDMPRKEARSLRKALDAVFGSPETTTQVLAFYGQRETAEATGTRPAEAEGTFGGEVELDVTDGTEGTDPENVEQDVAAGALTEVDLRNTEPTFRARNPDRPFLKGRDDAEVEERLREAGTNGRVVSLLEAVNLSDETPTSAIKRIQTDLEARIERSAARDTDSVAAAKELVREQLSKIVAQGQAVREQIARGDIDGDAPSLEGLREEALRLQELGRSLENRKTEVRADLPVLREELERIVSAESPEAALEAYQTVLADQNATAASDATMKKFRQLLDRKPNANIGNRTERAAKKEAVERIKKTAVWFVTKKGARFQLSAESMIYNSALREGSPQARFADSVASVLARSDVASIEPIPPGTILLRSIGLTYADVAPDVQSRGKLTKEDIERIKKEAQRKEYGKAKFAEAIFENRRKLLTALKKVKRDKLISLIEEAGIEGSEDTTLTDKELLRLLVTGSVEPRTRAETEALSPGKKEIEEITRTKATSEIRMFGMSVALRWIKTKEGQLAALGKGEAAARSEVNSQIAVLKDYIVEDLENLVPMIDSATVRQTIDENLQESGVQLPDGENLDARMLAEEQIERLQERLSLVEGSRTLTELIEGQIEDTKGRIDSDTHRARGRSVPSLTAGQQAASPIDTIRAPEPSAAERAAGRRRSNVVAHPNTGRMAGVPYESSSSKKSQAGTPGSPEASKAEMDAAIADIVKTRGDGVEIAFRTMAQIGGSGEFSMNEATKARLIKLAIDSGNVRGAAWHESLHDFFATLGNTPGERRLKKALIKAASSPAVRKQLRELLKGHPKALEQIATDPEERVAYMYQFWSEGVLTLNKSAAPVFQRIQDFIQRVVGIVTLERRAADILSSLQAGYFSDINTTARVIDSMRGDLVGDRLSKMAPMLSSALSKMAVAAPNGLRAYQNRHITKIADAFAPENGVGFLQRRFQEEGRWENRLASILDKATKAEQEAALHNMQSMKPPKSPTEKALAEFFKDALDYMGEAGVMNFDQKTGEWAPVRQVEQYFPRKFDRSAILRNSDEWYALLKEYVDAKAAKSITDALTHGTGQLDLAETDHHLGYTPFASAVLDRKLTFIDPSNAERFAKFQSTDLNDIVIGYVKQMVHRAEFAREFDNAGEKINDLLDKSGFNGAERDDIETKIRGLEGTLSPDLSSRSKEIMSWAMTSQNFILLPLTLASQVIDPIMIAARTESLRDAGSAYTTALARLKKSITNNKNKVEGEELATMLGIISADTALEAMGSAYGATYMSQGARNASRAFFKWNGMQGWNNSMRIAATVAGERYIIANKGNKQAMVELGLKASDVTTDGDGRLVWEPSNPGQAKRLREAMFAFVDSAVIRPSAAHRPAWMSDPRFLLVGHLKQFTFAMHNVILARAAREADNGNLKPALILMLNMPVILAADIAKMTMLGSPPQGWSYLDYLGHALQRSGLLGVGEFSSQLTKDTSEGKLPGEGLIGPTLEHVLKVMRWVADAPGSSFEGVIDRSVPLARYF